MALPLVECVPNFSEGGDPAIIGRVVSAVAEVPGLAVLHVDSGVDANRTVVTFAGSPDAVSEGAFRLVRQAAAEIDMRRQSGAHPRLGATDVVPFVPLAGATMETCIAIARSLGARVAAELGIPVYLYEHAASAPARRNLADVRRGEYEGLRTRFADPAWVPDFGPAQMNESAGATIIGARNFLVAFNVNLDTADVEVARTIASRVRTSGFFRDGKKIPGRLRACKAIGWSMPSFRCAQVSMNLTDLTQTGMLEAFRACEAEAAALGVRIESSELIGLVPEFALLAAGRELRGDADATALIGAAVAALRLDRFNEFKLEERVLDRVLAAKTDHYAGITR